jgi:hypothetical protein
LNEVELNQYIGLDDTVDTIPNDGVAELTYLNALIAWRQHHDLEKTTSLLDDAVKHHLRFVRDKPLTFEFYADLNANFVMELITEYNAHCPTDPVNPSTFTFQ